jgi:hypothetical protein
MYQEHMPTGIRNDGKPHKPNGNKEGSKPWSKKPKEERAVGQRVGERKIVDSSNWRRPALNPNAIKFDDITKGRFLDAILTHGKPAIAAKACEVSMQTVRNHLKLDPEFQELYDQVMQERAERVTKQIEEEALAGFEEPIFHAKTGELLGTKRVYETPIRLAILKRYDPEYKERSETTHAGTIGVLVAPAQVSPQDWIAREQQRNEKRHEPDKENLDAPDAARAAHRLMAPPEET